MKNDKIALTLGNPNGIGPEISAGALSGLKVEERSRFIVIGDGPSFRYYFGPLPRSGISFIEIYPPSGIEYKFNPGSQDAPSGAMSWLFLNKAAELAKNGSVKAIVTAPISKDLIVRAGHGEFTDHTTFLARYFGAEHVSMMFYSKDMKVILATIHLSLRSVPDSLTLEAVRTAVKNALLFGERFEGRRYRVAVCGLNPHAGENSLMGSEEKDVIAPVIREYHEKGYNGVVGPIPADTAFYRAYRGEFDCVAAMYHDQGLAPFKLLHFEDGVNVTLGLPVFRTSPDHGTAFDIAGKGKAISRSMEEAMGLALKLADGPSNSLSGL
ncbi:MAG: 4-hydroxythreonine-4-phosphate dehydrogenase PdxA [Brevinematales bacterium]|jgi:4-hydroxythreonine-4-phosphate dehydrogenase